MHITVPHRTTKAAARGQIELRLGQFSQHADSNRIGKYAVNPSAAEAIAPAIGVTMQIA